MRTVRLLTVSQHALPGVYLPGGVPVWGVYLPGGTCLGGVPAWGVYLPGGCTCLGGVPARGCLPGGMYPQSVYLPGGVPARGEPAQGVYLPRGCTCRGVPAQVLPPLWTEWETGKKILPCPKLRLWAVTRMHSSRMHTIRCSGRLSWHTRPPPPTMLAPLPHTHPAMHAPLAMVTISFEDPHIMSNISSKQMGKGHTLGPVYKMKNDSKKTLVTVTRKRVFTRITNFIDQITEW